MLAFKHTDRTDVTPAFAGMMAQAGRELLADADLIVAVPLHKRRLLVLLYNQSALLSLALAKIVGVTAAPDLLERTRATPSQGGLGAKAREREVSGAFAVKSKRKPQLAEQRVLLVDDVLTTGATVSACTKKLLRGGARAVDVLTLARVVRSAQE